MGAAREAATVLVENAMHKHLGDTALREWVDPAVVRPYTTLLNWFIPTEQDVREWEGLTKHTVGGAMDAIAGRVRGAQSVRQLIHAINDYPRVLGAHGYLPQALGLLVGKLFGDRMHHNADVPVCLKVLKRPSSKYCACRKCKVETATQQAMMDIQKALVDGRADLWATRQSVMPGLLATATLGGPVGDGGRWRNIDSGSRPTATAMQLQVVVWTRVEERLRHLQNVKVRSIAGQGQRGWQQVQREVPVRLYRWTVDWTSIQEGIT